MIRLGHAGLLAIAVLCACSTRANSGTTNTFTVTQRAQIVQIVRDALKKDPAILREAILALQADNARVEAAAARTSIARWHNSVFDPHHPSAGNPRGDVIIAEFFDPQCPYCRQLAPKMIHLLTQDGNVRLDYVDLPILGPASELGSRALLAAQRQGGYEPMRDAIMRDSREITLDTLRQTCEKLGLNWLRLRHDMDDREITRELAANKHLAKMLGVDGTPTFVIGGNLVAGADMPQIVDAVTAARRGGLPKQSHTTTKISLISQQQISR